jgi:hypothetical protein
MFNDDLTLADVAIRETADEAFQDTRAGFLKKGGVGLAALAGGGAVLGAIAPVAGATPRPPAKFGAGDIGILNFALTLEFLESEFYNQASRNLSSRLDARTLAFTKLVVKDEAAHVKFLRTALGRKAIAKPRFDFGNRVTDVTQYKKTASALENTGVHAYLGQAGNLKSKTYLGAAASIVTIEARHAAIINDIIGARITPDGPRDTPFTPAKVLAAAGPFSVS